MLNGQSVSQSQSGVPGKEDGLPSISLARPTDGDVQLPIRSIVISQPDTPHPDVSITKSGASETEEPIVAVAAAVACKKVFLPRCESYNDQCRVCQQETEELLIDLGCRCRGELAKVHRSCIDIWFRTKGSNKCEICQQVASNVPFPEPHPSIHRGFCTPVFSERLILMFFAFFQTNYWVWRVNSAQGMGQQVNERGCLNPLWVAFALLIGGLFLDVLISVSLGISSLPVNIITGILIVLGLAAALRLSLECCQEFGATRNLQTEVPINPGYHPAV